MKLEAVGASTFREAVLRYLTHAWGDLADSHWPKIDFDAGLVAKSVERRLNKFFGARRVNIDFSSANNARGDERGASGK